MTTPPNYHITMGTDVLFAFHTIAEARQKFDELCNDCQKTGTIKLQLLNEETECYELISFAKLNVY